MGGILMVPLYKKGKEITIDLGKFRNYFCVHGNSMKICLAQRVFQ